MNCVKCYLAPHIKKSEIKLATQEAEKGADAGSAEEAPIRESLLSVLLSGSVTPRSLMSCLKSNTRNPSTINYQADRFLFAFTQMRLSNLLYLTSHHPE